MVRYLSLGEFAEQANLSVNTLKGYATKGMLPQPDAIVGSVRGWLPSTAERWIAGRRL